MEWEDIWPQWPMPREAGSPAERGGATQDAFYEAGLIDDPGRWIQPIDVGYWDERLNPQSPEYDPDFFASVERENPSPEEEEAMEAERGWSRTPREPEPDLDLEAGF